MRDTERVVIPEQKSYRPHLTTTGCFLRVASSLISEEVVHASYDVPPALLFARFVFNW